ncbi:cold-shock DNA-binding domain-containing protein [Penicillium subrubescens]|uniref:cold-shock DNA-binding domain-containing protein n=1 Tax=Penicillium subrubescens TaxID=1316194 RepID=UPI0025454623|nr:cold-shock DNA-binding domain-containing protein [Penicillium subrubescens]KAJ5904909.1 cold-shock DNA-binding domain-containing protein [Penicillium subrubescens]
MGHEEPTGSQENIWETEGYILPSVPSHQAPAHGPSGNLPKKTFQSTSLLFNSKMKSLGLILSLFIVAASACSKTGVVTWFSNDKGYGFIRQDGSLDDVFVSYKNIVGEGYISLSEGQKVCFEVVRAEKGLQATDVQLVGEEETTEE